jgi:hypothetical protein
MVVGEPSTESATMMVSHANGTPAEDEIDFIVWAGIYEVYRRKAAVVAGDERV